MPRAQPTQPASAAAPRPARKDVARNRERLLAAANEVFAQRGADATLNDIARQAGLGNATAYRHFANKQELLAALLEDRFGQVLAIFQHADTLDDPREALESLLYELGRRQANDEGLRQALSPEEDDKTSGQINAKLRPIADRIVERAQSAGVVRPEFHANDLPLILRMIGAVSDYADLTAPDLWRRYLGFLLDGIAAEHRPHRAITTPAPSLQLALQSVPNWHRTRRRPTPPS